MSINWEHLAYGVAGALVLEMIGRPTSGKLVLPGIGRLPTLVKGDDTHPGMLENLFSSTPAA